MEKSRERKKKTENVKKESKDEKKPGSEESKQFKRRISIERYIAVIGIIIALIAWYGGVLYTKQSSEETQEVLKSEIQNLKEDLQEKEEELQGTKEELKKIKDNLQTTAEELEKKKEEFEDLHSRYNETADELENVTRGLQELREELLKAESIEKIEKDQNIIRAYNEYGWVLWSKEVGSTITISMLSDIDNNGMKEVIVGTNSDGTDNGMVYVWNFGGELLWKFQTGKEHYSGPDNQMNVEHIFVEDLDGDGQKEVVTNSLHKHYFPSRIVVLSNTGKKIGEYWNPGYVTDIVISDLDNDGIKEIIGSGLNNDLTRFLGGKHIPIAFLLKANDVKGEAPPYCKYSYGSHLWYGMFSRSDINHYYLGDSGLGESQLEVVDFNKDGILDIYVWLNDGRGFYINIKGDFIGCTISDLAKMKNPNIQIGEFTLIGPKDYVC